VEQPQKSIYIPTREGTEGLHVVREGDVLRVVMLDVAGRELDVVPVVMRPTRDQRTAA
jgi:hypothetical protein